MMLRAGKGAVSVTSVSNVAKRHNRAARRNFGSRNRHIAGAFERKLPPHVSKVSAA
jgi:hypothetical protein